MTKHITTDLEDKVKKLLRQNDYSPAQIASMVDGVSYHAVGRIHAELIIEMRKQEVTKLSLGSRQEPYQTEEEMLSNPIYPTTNHKYKSTLPKGWGLYQTID
jgi:hypothetical protein